MENISKNFENIVNRLKTTLVSCLNETDKVFIVPHNNMDFDALASSIAISDTCSFYGIDSCIVTNDNPSDMKPSFRELYLELEKKYKFIDTDEYERNKKDNSLVIITDSCVKNLIPISDVSLKKDKTIVIDHHIPDTKVITSGKLFVSSEASSASEILFYLMKDLDIYITTETAQLLLAGVYLDTNGLYFVNNPSGFKTIAKLLQYGANLQDVQNLFTISNFEDDMKQKELILKLLKCTHFYTDSNSRRYAICFNKNNSDTVYTNYQLSEACDSLLQYSLDAAFVIGYVDSEKLGEDHSNKIAIKARSKINENQVDVSSIMQLFDGGGDSNRAASTMEFNDIIKIKNCLKNIIKSTNNDKEKKEYLKILK